MTAAEHDPTELLTAEQVAAAHGVTVNAIYTRINRKAMPPADEILHGRFMRWRWATVSGLTFRHTAVGRPQA